LAVRRHYAGQTAARTTQFGDFKHNPCRVNATVSQLFKAGQRLRWTKAADPAR
jgi:hypothetical protein